MAVFSTLTLFSHTAEKQENRYIQIGLNFQFHRKKLILTTKPPSAIRQVMVCVK
jgi:hypothetical protein